MSRMHWTRFTASIALGAYLLGGWLLPAVHQHAAHGEHTACEHAHTVAHAHPVASAPSAHDSSCHPPSSCPSSAPLHCDGSSPAAAAHGDLAANFASLDQHWPVVSCDGLCVLCHVSARKFTSTVQPATCYVRAGPTQRIALVDQPLGRSLRLRIDGPRGPPAPLG